MGPPGGGRAGRRCTCPHGRGDAQPDPGVLDLAIFCSAIAARAPAAGAAPAGRRVALVSIDGSCADLADPPIPWACDFESSGCTRWSAGSSGGGPRARPDQDSGPIGGRRGRARGRSRTSSGSGYVIGEDGRDISFTSTLERGSSSTAGADLTVSFEVKSGRRARGAGAGPARAGRGAAPRGAAGKRRRACGER